MKRLFFSVLTFLASGLKLSLKCRPMIESVAGKFSGVYRAWGKCHQEPERAFVAGYSNVKVFKVCPGRISSESLICCFTLEERMVEAGRW